MTLAMEFLSFPLLLCVISFTSLLLYTLVKKNKSKPTNQERPILPPGRTGWPVIGETLDYFSKFQNGVSEKFVAERSNKYSPKVFKTSLIGQPMAFLCGPEGNKFLFSNEKKLVRVWYPMSLRKIFPEVQEKERKMFHTFLKADALRKYVGTMDMLMKQHLETEWNREEVSVNPMVKKYILTLACRLIIGIDDPNKVEELATLIERVEAGIFSVPVNLPGTTLNHAMKAAKEIIKDVLNIIRQRKADLLNKDSASMQDILSLVFLTADENGSFLNESDIAGSILGLLVGGYSGISGTVTIIMKYLAELPHAYDEVLREHRGISNAKEPKELLTWEDFRYMRYSWSVASEILRLHAPAPGTFREAITDFTYAGYTIPKGWKLHWIANATNKNPEYFPDPHNFDPSRFEGKGPAPYTFAPFGGGPRMCPGNEYARLAILVFIHNVVQKFKWEKLIPSEKVVNDPFPVPANGLPVRLHRHN